MSRLIDQLMFLTYSLGDFMQYKTNRCLKLFILFIPVSFLLNSCDSNFKSVESFVNNNKSGIKTYADILAQDIYDSCLRRANYIPLINKNGIELRETAIEECNKFNKPNIELVKEANDVLLNYMTVLGQVASGKTVSFDKNISELQTALTGLKIGNSKLSEPTVTAGTNILSILVNALSKSEREKALKKAILCSDDSLQNYITGSPTSKEDKSLSGGLIGIAQDGYISKSGILEIEKTTIDGYYKTYFSAIEKSNGSQIAAELEAQKDYNKAIEIIQNKRDNAESYIKILTATAKAHHQLKNEFQGTGKDTISTEEVNELCRSVLAGKVSNLEKSNDSAKLNLSEQQLRKAKLILAEYSQTVELLRKDNR